MACLRKRVNKKGTVYDVDFTVDGKRYIRSTMTSDLRVAKQILHDIQGKIARGRFNLEEYDRKEITLKRFIDEHLAYARKVKKESTVDLQQIHAATFLRIVGDRNLRAIRPQILDHWKAERLGKIKPSTFNIEKRSLQAIFGIARKWGYIESNPFVDVTLMKTEERRLYLTDDELQRLFEVIDQDIVRARNSHHRRIHQLFRAYVEFLLNTGLRRNEGLQLRRENVDMVQGVVFIGKTKDKDARIIPLTRRALTILENIGENLFGDLKSNTATQKFISAASRAKLEGFKLHSIRHYAESRTMPSGHVLSLPALSHIVIYSA